MRYRTRLVLLVTGLLASAVLVISGVLAWNTREALLASAEGSGQMVANLLARSAGLANEIPGEVEDYARCADGGRGANRGALR